VNSGSASTFKYALRKLHRSKRMAHPPQPSWLASALSEQPILEPWFGENPLPDVVIHASVLGVERVSARFPSCRDTVARHGHRHGLVGAPVEFPKRCVKRCVNR
jgi:hypothetical protein